MKKWEWSCTTNTVYTNFDSGEVFAPTYDKAREKIEEYLNEKLTTANKALRSTGLEVHMDYDNIHIVESEVNLPDTISIAFWSGGSYDCPYYHGQKFVYSTEQLSEIITTILICGLNSMVQTTGTTDNSVIVWIDSRKFTQR